MSNFLKTLTIILCLLSTGLNAQKNSLDESLQGKMLNESLAAFQFADSDSYGALFMPKAELIDASGTVIEGRDAIVKWHKALMIDCADAHGMKREALSKHTRFIRPDLAIAVATTRITCDDHSCTVAYNCFFRRIDGKWYVETCAIVPVQETFTPRIEAAKK